MRPGSCEGDNCLRNALAVIRSLQVVGRSFYGFGGCSSNGDLLLLRSHVPLLICILIKNQDHLSRASGVHGRSLLLKRLAILLFKAEGEFSRAERLDVVPVRSSGSDGTGAKGCAWIIDFQVFHRRARIVLNGDINSARVTSKRKEDEANQEQADGNLLPQRS